MLCAIRRTRVASLLALATLVSVISLSAATLFHSEADDTICNPVLTVHDHNAHRVGAAAVSSHSAPDHCAICHWQTLRTVAIDVVADVPGGEGLRFVSSVVTPSQSAPLARQPARAPPAA